MGEEACEEAFGIFPCSSSLYGSVILMLMYGFWLLQGANLLSDGSELLLEVLDPGVIGGLLLPVLGAMPDTLIIIFAGLGGTVEEAAEQVAVGVGALAGSTIMLLTICWGGAILLGRCDYDRRGKPIDKVLTKKTDFVNTGVTSTTATKLNAGIMLLTTLLYLTIQIPTFLGHGDSHAAAAYGAALCLACLVLYSVFQVVYPELQKAKIARARARREQRLHAAHAVQEMTKPLGGLLTETGEIKAHIIRDLFKQIDSNNDGTLDRNELQSLLTGLSLASTKGRVETAAMKADIDYWMKEFDKDSTGSITEAEFVNELSKWLRAQMLSARGLDDVGSEASFTITTAEQIAQPLNEGAAADVEDDEEVEEHAVLSPRQVVIKAVIFLTLGTAVCAVMSDPLVDAVTSFSAASGIPSFFVAFAVAPFASNASELVSSLKFAAKKRDKNIQLTFSQVYGAVTMNNTMCLGVFLAVVAYRGLTWTYTSEVATLVLVTGILGVVAMSVTRIRAWMAFPVLLLYPGSIYLVYLGDYVLMWDGPK